MIVGIKYHLHYSRRYLAWKKISENWQIHLTFLHNLVHYLIAFYIFDKLLYYFIKSSITIGRIILLQWCDEQGALSWKRKHKKKNS